MSIFNHCLLPTEDSLPSYGNEQIKILAEFYGQEAEVQCAGMTYTSPPLLHGDELLSEWKIFRRALLLEKKAIMERKKESVSPSLQHILDEMETSHTYGGIFPETWKLLKIMMTLPVGTASVERSFSQMKLIKTLTFSRLRKTNVKISVLFICFLFFFLSYFILCHTIWSGLDHFGAAWSSQHLNI